MGFTCGLVGLPNAGKSTLFGALTRTKAQAGNYAFTTIEPNSGIVPVPDKRLDTITHYVQTKKIVPTTMEFVDIAGLIKGASKGEGLGNKFLGHIREVDAIAHVVRCFEDGNVPHVSDIIDPASDIDTINTELIIIKIYKYVIISIIFHRLDIFKSITPYTFYRIFFSRFFSNIS